MSAFANKLQSFKVIPVLVIENPDYAIELGETLINSGLPVVEVTLRTPGSWEAISNFKTIKNLSVGVGSVSSESELDRALDIGVDFAVSAGFNVDLATHAKKIKLDYLPGVSSPSELLSAKRMELEVVKYFPAETLGGVAALKAIAAPFPSMNFVPTGGISLKNFKSYLAEKNVIAVGGSWMVSRELIQSGDFAKVAHEIRELNKYLEGEGD